MGEGAGAGAGNKSPLKIVDGVFENVDPLTQGQSAFRHRFDSDFVLVRLNQVDNAAGDQRIDTVDAYAVECGALPTLIVFRLELYAWANLDNQPKLEAQSNCSF